MEAPSPRRQVWFVPGLLPACVTLLLAAAAGPIGAQDGGGPVRLGSRRMRHPAPLVALALSADGGTLAAADRSGGLRLHDVATGEERGRPEAGGEQVTALAYLPDGGGLLAGCASGALLRSRPAAAEPTPRLDPLGTAGAGPVRALAISPDGSEVAVAGGDDPPRIVALETGRVRLTLPDACAGAVSLAWSPDGSLLAVGGGDGRVRLTELDPVAVRVTITTDTAGDARCAFSADGSRLVTGGVSGVLRFWSAASGVERGEARTSLGAVTALASGPVDGRLAVGCAEGGAALLDVNAGTVGPVLTGHSGPVTCVVPGGALTVLTGGEDGTVRSFDVEDGTERFHGGASRFVADIPGRCEPRRDHVIAVVFAPDGRTLLSVRWDREVRIWDAVTGQRLRSLRAPGHPAATTIVGAAITSAGDPVVVWARDLVLLGEEISSGRRVLDTRLRVQERLALGARGGVAAVTGDSGALRILPVTGTPAVESVTGQGSGPAADVALDPAEETAAVVMADGSVRVVDLAGGTVLGEFPPGTADGASAVAVGPGGAVIALGGPDGAVRVMAPADGTVRRFVSHDGAVLCLAFSPDGDRLAGGGADGTVLVLDPR